MNRVTALLLAMATLLAHSLAVHRDERGRFGQPYEVAHNAYHLARNLVRQGEATWNVGAQGAERAGLEAYPSPLWVGVAAVSEQLYLPVNIFTQGFGILAALLAIAISARFATDRIAGVIPPLLLVTSGGFAAAATSGTEIPLVALLAVASFVSLEQRRALPLALSSALLVLVRPEGILLVACLLIFALLHRAGWREDRGPSVALWSFLPAAAGATILFLARDGRDDSLYGTMLGTILHSDGDRITAGGAYLWDFVATAVTPLLIVFPLLTLITGQLSGLGRRALLLGLLWSAGVLLEGGGPQPYAMALVPALPLLAIAIQQGIVAALDTHIRFLENLAWGALLTGSLLSALASKFPRDKEGLHARWMGTASAPAPYGAGARRGRLALGEEILRTAELRALGRFLRENVDPRLSILTPWTGALGYLSQMQVLDLFGRFAQPEGAQPTAPWPLRPRVDVAGALERGADFILPGFITREDITRPDSEQDQLWLGGIGVELGSMDLDPSDPVRTQRIQSALEKYELVTLPVIGERGSRRDVPRPVYLLRRRALGIAPQLELTFEGGTLLVDAYQGKGGPDGDLSGHPQLVRLEVVAQDQRGRRWYLSPLGEPSQELLFARSELRLEPGAGRPVRLFSCTLPTTVDGASLRVVRARLFNPAVRRRHPLAPVSEEKVLNLPP